MSSNRNLAFQTLRHRDFRLLWAADTIAMLGTQMQRVAIMWQVYVLTNDPFQLGLLALVRFLPILVFGIVGGVIADQRDRRQVLIWAHVGLFLTSGTLAVATFADMASIWLIYLVTFVSSTFNAGAGPARQALIPNLVERREIAGAATIVNLSMQTAGIIGPALGGVLIGPLGVGALYFWNALSFVAVIVAAMMMRVRPEPMKITTKGLAAAKEGFVFLFATPILLAVMALDFAATFFGTTNTLMPIFAEEILGIGAGGMGLLLSSIAAGAVIGSLVMSVLPVPQRPGRAIIIAIVAYGACIVGFGLSTNLVLSVLFLAGSGAADSISMAMRHAIRNLVTPDEYRGRIAAAHSTFAMGGPQLGEFRAGAVAALIGTPGSVALGGMMTIASCLIAMRMVPTLTRYDTSSWDDGHPEPSGRPAPADAH
ncbi:MAG TPA: MFS transporter [Thermomicrobiales bacterium]|nr:MFS transporter [Thermomicrobiales bacterium]